LNFDLFIFYLSHFLFFFFFFFFFFTSFNVKDKRLQVKKLLHEFGSKIDKLYKKLGSCVDKARPYYEAKKNGKKLQLETQKATLKFERACSSHLAAQEMVSLAEQVFVKKGRIFDPVWQEMIDQTTNRVNQIEMERVQSEKEHMITSKRYNEEEQLIQRLQQKLKRSIAKARYKRVNKIAIFSNDQNGF